MANKVKVWTKQHEGILQVLDQTGRFLAQKLYSAENGRLCTVVPWCV